MKVKYVSFDIEASGPSPGKYSMLSLGACIVGQREIQFYRELKPISTNFIESAMRIGCLGLHCLDDLIENDEYNPQSKKFDPVKVLEVLEEKGDAPQDVMKEYAAWVRENTKGFEPICAAAPIKFDGMFTTWYFDNFYSEENPFKWRGEDMNSFYRGVIRNPNKSMRSLGLKDDRECPHNALDDALFQAKQFEKVLEML